MRHHLLKLLAVLTACLLTACIDGHEEYWFNASGGGRAKLTYTLPAVAAEFNGGEAAIREKVAAFLKGNEAFTTSSSEVVTLDGRMRVTVEVAFDSVKDLQKLSSRASVSDLPDATSAFRGNIDLEMKGMTLDFTRKISAGKGIPGALFIPKRELEGHQLVYVVHLPMEAKESNATRTEDGGSTLVWEIPLATALREPFITHFQARIPLPHWALASLGGLLLVAIVIFTKWRRGRKLRVGK